MRDEDAAFWVLLLIVAVLTGLLVFVTNLGPSQGEKEEVVCEYKGGEMKEDVCVINGRVVVIDLEEAR